MKTILASLLLVALAAPLFAGEAEQANAKKFLDSQTAVNEAALGESTLKFRMLGTAIGSMTVKVEAGEYEGTKCYVLTMNGAFELGVKNTMTGTSYIAPNMALLHAESKETEGDKTSEHTVFTVKDGVITAVYERPTKKDKAEQNQTYTIKQVPGLLLKGGEMLVPALLPREAGKKYEFTRWSDEADETYTLLITADGKEDAGFHFIEAGKTFKKGPMGEITSKDNSGEMWFDGAKLVRMVAPEGFILDSAADEKRTPITREMVDKRDDALVTAAGFFLASGAKDEELLKTLLNEEKIVRANLDENPMTKGLSDEEKDAAAKQYAPMVIQQVLNSGGEKSAEDAAREKAITTLLLSKENFEVSEKDGVTTVTFTEAARKLIGNLSFVVAKDDAGKWEITRIISGGDDEEKKEEDGF